MLAEGEGMLIVINKNVGETALLNKARKALLQRRTNVGARKVECFGKEHKQKSNPNTALGAQIYKRELSAPVHKRGRHGEARSRNQQLVAEHGASK